MPPAEAGPENRIQSDVAMVALMAFAAPVLSLVIEHPLLIPDWLSRRPGDMKGIRSECALETLSLLPIEHGEAGCVKEPR